MLDEFINKNFIYAVVGASNNKEKYGYKVIKDLITAGYNAIPINLKETQIIGVPVYPSITELSKHIQINSNKFVVNFVIPPQVVVEVLKEVKELGIKKVWMQPGSESEEAIRFCKDNLIDCIYNKCIMVERKIIDLNNSNNKNSN